MFHKNSKPCIKAKIAPPRLNGARVGVFSTRSPHRPNPIGLTLAKVEKVEGDTIYLRGMDLMDQTPIIDIKPYIPSYDSPQPVLSTDSAPEDEGEGEEGEKEEERHGVPIATGNEQDHVPDADEKELNGVVSINVPFITEKALSEASSKLKIERPIKDEKDIPTEETPSEDAATVFNPDWTALYVSLPVFFTDGAMEQIGRFSADAADPDYRLSFLKSSKEAVKAIRDILSADPRGVYRKTKGHDLLYFCIVDTMHVTSWFDEVNNKCEVVRVMPYSIRKATIDYDKMGVREKRRLET